MASAAERFDLGVRLDHFIENVAAIARRACAEELGAHLRLIERGPAQRREAPARGVEAAAGLLRRHALQSRLQLGLASDHLVRVKVGVGLGLGLGLGLGSRVRVGARERSPGQG